MRREVKCPSCNLIFPADRCGRTAVCPRCHKDVDILSSAVWGIKQDDGQGKLPLEE